MRIPGPLEQAEFLERPNRFLVLARLSDGRTARVHCPDPGRLQELLRPNAALYVSPAKSPGRSTTHDLRLVRHPENGVLVSVDSRLPNKLFAEAASAGALAPFPPPVSLQAEVPLPHSGGRIRSRADFVLTDGSGTRWWIEVKSVTLVVDGVGYFPDAVTERGRRHVLELAELAKRGERAAVCFIVQRPDARMVRPEWGGDPAFAQALLQASRAGVRLYAWTARVTLSEIALQCVVPVDPYPAG